MLAGMEKILNIAGTASLVLRKTWKKDKVYFISCAFLLVLFIICMVGITPHDAYRSNLDRMLEPPSPEYRFGTDQMGRDILSRIILGGRSTFYVAFVSVLIPVVFGTPIGIISGYFGKWTDEVIMRLVDTLLSFPAMILAIGIINALQPSLTNAVIAIGIIFIPRFTRLVRGQVLKLSKEAYVEAGRAIGASHLRIMTYHILPGVVPLVIVQATLGLGIAIQVESALSFLGLGAQVPQISWGVMLKFGFLYMGLTPWPVVFTGLVLALTIVSFNFFGDGLRNRLDVRTR